MVSAEVLVVISWITYFVPFESVPGRLGPLVVLLLALVNLHNNDKNLIPDNKNPVYLDFFHIINIMQVFIVVIFYGLVLFRVKFLQKGPGNEGYIKQEISASVKKIDLICFVISATFNVIFLFVYFSLAFKNNI